MNCQLVSFSMKPIFMIHIAFKVPFTPRTKIRQVTRTVQKTYGYVFRVPFPNGANETDCQA